MGKEEISGRFYEGVAAGTVLLGEPPRSDHFRAQFDWEDAVIHLPFDSPDAVRILESLDADPNRLARIRRLRTVYETVGLRPTPKMLAREDRLRALAAMARDGQLDAA